MHSQEPPAQAADPTAHVYYVALEKRQDGNERGACFENVQSNAISANTAHCVHHWGRCGEVQRESREGPGVSWVAGEVQRAQRGPAGPASSERRKPNVHLDLGLMLPRLRVQLFVLCRPKLASPGFKVV